MTATPIGLSPAASASVTPTITLDSLAAGAVATSSAFTNPTTPDGNFYQFARLEINLGASTAVGTSGTPNISAVIFGSAAGSSLVPPTGVSNGQLYPITDSRPGGETIPSTSTQLLIVKDLPVDPVVSPLLSVLNNLGVAFPTSGVTATLYFYTPSAG